ncbi:DUF6893 family small protein [Paractinoplanes ovalisporus]|nr:hypothetical protein [Actinoplanes ovalisporus]
MLKFIGFVTLVVTGLVFVWLANLLLASIPDIQRYLRIRSM